MLIVEQLLMDAAALISSVSALICSIADAPDTTRRKRGDVGRFVPPLGVALV